MIRKDGDRQKRSSNLLPTTYVGNNRQMLSEIRDSLSHLRKNQQVTDSMQIKSTEHPQLAPPLTGDPRTSATAKASNYRQKALAEIRNQLLPFANEGLSSASSTVSTISSTTTSGISSASGLSSTSGSSSPCQSVEHNGLEKDLSRLTVLAGMGYDEDPAVSRALKAGIRTSGGDVPTLDMMYKMQAESQQNGLPKQVPAGLSGIASKIIRKPSFEGNVRDVNLNIHRMSPGLDSGAGSTRSDSPSIPLSLASRSTFDSASRNGDPMSHLQVSRQYSPNFCGEPPPPPPPRSQGPPPTPPRGTTPPPPIPPSQSDVRLSHSQQVHQMLKRISPAPQTSRPGQGLGYSSALSQSSTPQRGTSPVAHGRSPIVVQNSIQQQLQISHQISALYNGGVSQMEPPPPYPIGSAQTSSTVGSVSLATKIASPPPYTSVATSRQSPTQTLPSSSLEYAAALQQKRTSPTMYPASGPITSVASSVAASSVALKAAPLQAWSPISPPIMLSVKSTQVQKPVLQTAVAPTAPPSASSAPSLPSYTSAVQQKCHAVEAPISPVVGSNNVSGVSSVTSANSYIAMSSSTAAVASSYNAGPSIVVQTSIPTTDPPSYASTMQALAAQRGVASIAPSVSTGSNNGHHANYGVQYSSPATASPAPLAGTTSASHEARLRTSPSPPSAGAADGMSPCRPPQQQHAVATQVSSSAASLKSSAPVESYGATHHHQSVQRKFSPIAVESPTNVSCSSSLNSNPSSISSQSPVSFTSAVSPQSDMQEGSSPSGSNGHGGNTNNNGVVCGNNCGGSNNGNAPCAGGVRPFKMTHQSPIPERKMQSREKEEERCDTKVRNYSPQAFKFYMEQHMENVLKSHQQRLHRRVQLETEMAKVGLSEEAQFQMRKMLHQKESNYIRLKRAKMNKAQFVRIKLIGVGAFGEVALVRKLDTQHLYAMKTLRKADVLKRNQVAHVKAERDILAEADNEWVVKLYYSFQDQENLYFVMDYIPGGDLMSLLIKFGIFQESLARFYIAELVCAVESVHKMGFIHRDIKPDNILIDRDGHIKLTDFGLCTGFRWTHNSKYYQNGEHSRQDSMEPDENWPNKCQCNSSSNLKPLERRRRREHQRCLAHSLVGTPNYIAPEVLMRTGYTHVCDWWSVGVILYEMLVGQPPFLANTPVETQYKVINWETTLKIPRNCNLSSEAKDLILKLCCSHDRRLGKNGTSEVKAHAFFDNVDFEGGIRRQPAPYTPSIRHATDTSNFDPVDQDRLRNSDSSDSEDKGMSGYDNGQHPEHAFFEFTFRRFFDDGGHAYPTRLGTDDNDNQGPVYV